MVDLGRFELPTSSMPFKKYQSLADSLAESKGLNRLRIWTPLDSTEDTGKGLDSRRTPSQVLSSGAGPAISIGVAIWTRTGVYLSMPHSLAEPPFFGHMAGRLDLRPAGVPRDGGEVRR
jgi:hypothetical protein